MLCSELTEEVSSLFRFTEQWRPNPKLVLGHDPELILVVFCQANDYKGTLLRVIRDMDPRFSVVLTLLHNIVSDLGSTIVCGWIPGKANPLCKDLGELDWSERWARWSCRGGSVRMKKQSLMMINCGDATGAEHPNWLRREIGACSSHQTQRA